MWIVAACALVDLLAAVRGLAQLGRFVMALHADLQQRMFQQVRLVAAVHIVALGALSLGYRGMAHLRAEIANVAAAARIRKVFTHLHSLRRVVTALALPCKVRRV